MEIIFAVWVLLRAVRASGSSGSRVGVCCRESLRLRLRERGEVRTCHTNKPTYTHGRAPRVFEQPARARRSHGLIVHIFAVGARKAGKTLDKYRPIRCCYTRSSNVSLR